MSTDRAEFEMSQEQLERLRSSMKPVPYIVVGGIEPPSPREMVSAAWRELGDEMGFVWDTAWPSGRGERFFTAVPKPSAMLAERAKDQQP